MRWFLCKILLFLGLVLGSVIVVFYLAGGTTDAFYKKFTSPKQSSLIIGTSRAAQGIQPEVINLHMGVGVYNYAFSRVHTPYGKLYYDSVLRKLDTTSTNGVFILEVNPWTISDYTIENGIADESQSFLGSVGSVASRPNFSYLLYGFQDRYITILGRRFFKQHPVDVFVHDDGWVEVSFTDEQQNAVEKRERSTLDSYAALVKTYQGISEQRLAYLERLITTLQSYGHVYLVRLPVADGMLRIETEYMPDFDRVITRLSETYKVPYINAVPDRALYSYTDGHHLDIPSGKRFSEYLVNQIEALH